MLTGFSTPKGLDRLQVVWVVDVKSTMLEHSINPNNLFLFLDNEEDRTPDNFSRIRYEFHGDQLKSFIFYKAEQDSGTSSKVSVYDEDDDSVIVLMHPEINGYTSLRPPLDELIKKGQLFDRFFGVYGLRGFEFTGENEARMFFLAIDAKGNPIRRFSGLHLIKSDGPIPKRKPQLPERISLENPSQALSLSLFIPEINDTHDIYFFSIHQCYEKKIQKHTGKWKVLASRHKNGVKIKISCRWDSGLCETFFIVPYEDEVNGHKNGITYKATWEDKNEASKALEKERNDFCSF